VILVEALDDRMEFRFTPDSDLFDLNVEPLDEVLGLAYLTELVIDLF